MVATSEDAVLGGRLRLRQPLSGHRVGHDAILLAAATEARNGEHAIDLGSGVGSAGLALAARVTGLRVTLIEIDTKLIALADENIRLNDMTDRVRAIRCDAEDHAELAAAGLAANCADRVLMNPPFHDARRHNLSPDPSRRLAYAATPGLLDRWIASAGWLLKLGGVLTLIWRADEVEHVVSALAGKFGSLTILPIAPRDGAPPIRMLVRAVREAPNGRGPVWLSPLILNDANGKPTAAVNAVLREGQELTLT